MPELNQLELRARIGQILNRWPAVGLAVGVVRNGRLGFFHGHGFADIASNTPVTEDKVFRIGSITKTFTAIAVMQLAPKGIWGQLAERFGWQLLPLERRLRIAADARTT